ncbi:DUF1702 family protein [Anabaena sp. UHCC 0399]|uniref:DUF1702 family protein n=1 Tax=Anabaena sp. UHCC 0399 TaxID=3110238 RepID=UPI002B21CA0A|nr:DUF1702 family protein [Anabaena sp. UHCC 0399]MEA5563988.1 DUF1702 family protein [Anabaena sp. UHCC 0399]
MIQDAVQARLNEDKTLPINIWAERGISAIIPSVQQRMQQIRGTLIQGFQAAIANDQSEAIIANLDGIADELRGFAFEGVGMGLTQRDLVAPTQHNRVESFIAATGTAYEHFVYVGVGLMLGKTPLPLEPCISQLNPDRVWLVIDGYGFQHGLSHWQKYLDQLAIPENLSGYAVRVFDQGMGRSIWFVDGTDATHISKTIAAFPPSRQADLWGGIGFVCTYSGGAERATLEALKIAAGAYQFALIQGSAFAAKSRQKIGSYSPHTQLACEVLWGMEAARVAENPHNQVTPDPEVWQHYRSHLVM